MATILTHHQVVPRGIVFHIFDVHVRQSEKYL
jgi:hypothetical protein